MVSVFFFGGGCHYVLTKLGFRKSKGTASATTSTELSMSLYTGADSTSDDSDEESLEKQLSYSLLGLNDDALSGADVRVLTEEGFVSMGLGDDVDVGGSDGREGTGKGIDEFGKSTSRDNLREQHFA